MRELKQSRHDDSQNGACDPEESVTMSQGLMKYSGKSRLMQHEQLSRFWHRRDGNQKQQILHLAQGIPLATEDMAGFRKVFTTLLQYRPGRVSRVLQLVWLWFGMALNLGTAIVNASDIHRSQTRDYRNEVSGIVFTINMTHVNVCFEDRVCESFHMDRFASMHLLVPAEGFAIMALTLTSIIFSLRFVCLSDDNDDGVSKRGTFYSSHPVMFIVLPRYASSFSFMKFIRFGNLPHVAPLFTRNDPLPYKEMVMKSARSLFGASGSTEQFFEASSSSYELSDCSSDRDLPLQGGGEDVETTFLQKLLAACWIAIAFALAFQMLMYKFMNVFFIVYVSFYNWTLMEWAQVLAFINQLLGIRVITLDELFRLFLFMLGGKDSKWQVGEAQLVASYVSLLGEKLINSKKLAKQRARGFVALAVFATFGPDDLQALLLGDHRASRIKLLENERKDFYEEIFNQEHLGKGREGLVHVISDPIPKLINHALQSRGGNDKEKKNMAGERLRLAADLADMSYDVEYPDLESNLQ